MLKNNLILYHYRFLILILIVVILVQFAYIVILKIKGKKKNIKKVNLENLSLIITPLNQKINSLKKDKANYIQILSEVEEEIKLYSEQILNIIELGVLIVDKDYNIIYKNKWISTIKNMNDIIEIENNSIEKEINNSSYLIKKQEYENMSIYTVTDITELKKLEKEIVMKEKLAYLGEMSASIAHEFKNSLTAIKGFSSALKRKSKDYEIVEKISLNIEEEVNYFHKILIDYLDYSKEIVLEKKEVNPKTFIENITNNIFTNKNINIINSVDYIYIDDNKMKQVFINLIKNSIEASPEDSLIEIEIKNIRNVVQITIKDEGRGITEENLKKIFNPFFTTKSSGTGLGTSISYQIIKAHKGNLIYQNRNTNKGVLTIIEIPTH
jgi:signal transduction histidine kinase